MQISLDSYPAVLVWAGFIVAAVVVWVVGVRLTRVLDRLAEQTGVGRTLIGMLLLGGITSLPELANTIGASSAGQPRLAVNNLLGSAAINVFLLAAVDAVIGRKAVTAVQAQPATLMMCVLTMLLLILTAAAIITGDTPVLGVGLWSVVISLASIAFFGLASSYDSRAPWRVREQTGHSGASEEGDAEGSVPGLALQAAGLAAAIFVAGYTLSLTGEAIAERSGWGVGVVGFLLIGLATSLPELSTITTALRLRQYELAFGQVLGTNFINIALLVVADLTFAGGPVIAELGRFEVILALLGALLTGVFLVGLLERRDPRIMRMGYDSLAVIILFAGASLFLVLTREA